MVLPLLALTWMSAVLAVTDRRSALFQILFAVFDSLEGFVIVMVHCILRREVGGPAGAEPSLCPALGPGRVCMGGGAPSFWAQQLPWRPRLLLRAGPSLQPRQGPASDPCPVLSAPRSRTL